jgi:hypothetical protein
MVSPKWGRASFADSFVPGTIPARSAHDGCDGGAARPAQQSQHPRLLRIRPPGVLASAPCPRPNFRSSLRLDGSPAFALGHAKNSSRSCRRNVAPPPPKPRGGPRSAGGGEEPSHSGLLSVITTHALLAGKVQRKVSNGVAQLGPSQRCKDSSRRMPLSLLASGER